MKRGFTILELLVASLLLSMLVTMLTMIFNQSSLAWNTGVASVSDLETVRRKIGGYHDVADDALPGIGETANNLGNRGNIQYRTVSLFRNWSGSGQLQASTPSLNCSGRAVDQIDWAGASLSQYNDQDAWSGKVISSLGTGDRRNAGNGGYVVGVRSAGPDRKWNTDDDINTFPEDVK